jgi:HD-like signal output (HDOD) protein/ActR/RegA family two-component response regulator
MKKILLVDDDQNTLQSFKRAFHSMHREWKVVLRDNGKSAFDLIQADDSFDLIVCDLRMDGLNGIDLLKKVKDSFPDTIRFSLTGSTESSLLIEAASVSHRLISKPCEAEKLIALIKNSLLLRERLLNPSVRKNLCRLGVIPSLPRFYQDFCKEIQSPDVSVAKLGTIIEKDIGMTAKVLQLVNSAFFGFRRKVTSPVQAATLIGINGMRDIVLVAGFFNAFGENDFPKTLDIEGLWQHSLMTANRAKSNAASEGLSQDDIDTSYTAGLLHDLGIIALAATNRPDYEEVITLAGDGCLPLHQAERKILAVDHATVGGFILDLWGLPHAISEIVAFHCSPPCDPSSRITPLSIVCAADILAAQEKQSLLEKGGERSASDQSTPILW